MKSLLASMLVGGEVIAFVVKPNGRVHRVARLVRGTSVVFSDQDRYQPAVRRSARVMRRVRSFGRYLTAALVAVGCWSNRGKPAEVLEARAPTAADSAGAELLARTMDRPPAKFAGVEWLGGPPAPAERATAGVVMAFVVEDGRVLPNTLAVLHTRGPLAYAKNVCVAMTAMRLRVIAGQPLQSAVVMPLSNATDRGHAEVVAAGTRIQATLKEMSVPERRDWLLQWGCARFR